MKNPVLLCLLLLAACQNPIDKARKDILDSFKSVNSSLTTSMKEFDKKYATERGLGIWHEEVVAAAATTHPDWVVKADTLYAQSLSILQLLKYCKEQLKEADSAGMSTTVAHKFFTHDPRADSIYIYLAAFPAKCRAAWVSPDSTALLDEDLKHLNSNDLDHMHQEQFKDDPTVAASTVMSYYETSVLKSAVLVMKQMKERL